jgi:hypothetical protein
MEKSSIIKVSIILFRHLWEVELTYRYIFAPGVVYVVDTGGDLDMRISPRIFGSSEAGGKLIHEKSQKQKNLVTLSL